MTVVNMRQLSRGTKAVVEEVVRSGRPAIVTVNGRPQVAVTPLVGAVEAVEDKALRDAPEHLRTAIRSGEADLIAGRATVTEESVFAGLPEEDVADVLDELANQNDAAELEEVIRSSSQRSDPVADVRRALDQIEVFALARPSEMAKESNLLHFEGEDDEGNPATLLPIFTRVELVRPAVLRRRDWQSLYVLRISGSELLENVEADVTIVIDPWSDLQFQIPHSGRHTLLTAQRPLVAAAKLVTTDGSSIGVAPNQTG